MIKFNLNLFRKLLQDLSQLTNTVITFYDTDFNSTSAHSEMWSAKAICSLVKRCNAGGCSLSDRESFERLNAGNDAFYYACHFGLIEMAFRVRFNEITYGYIIAGPFRDPEKQKENLQNVRALCKETHADYDQMVLQYKRIPKFSVETFRALQSVLSAILDHAKESNIIYDRTDMFSDVIEPYIDKNLHTDLTIEKLCEDLFLTQKQLYSTFHVNVKTTPKHYIAEKRVKKARNLIISTDLSLPEIASMVGVNDYNYFIKVFKSFTGHTPMYYRKKR